MTYYRLYRLNDAGRIFGVDAAEYETEAEAIQRARELVGAIAGCAVIEGWDRARLAFRVAGGDGSSRR